MNEISKFIVSNNSRNSSNSSNSRNSGNFIEYHNELLYWIKIGNYINKTDKLDRLDFLYKQCTIYH